MEQYMRKIRRVYARVDLDRIVENIRQLRRRLPEEARLIAVVKTDAYGHGAPQVASALEHRSYIWGFATATMDEAVTLRQSGISKPILVLGCVFPDEYEEMIRLDIRAAIYRPDMAVEMAETAKRLGKKALFHIKIDTGMGRIGFLPTPESVEEIVKIYGMEHVQVEGMFTHFACADEKDKTKTDRQHERFLWIKHQLEQKNIRISYFDCDNSAGIIDFPYLCHDLSRAGIAMYGIYPSDDVDHTVVELQPALSLYSTVIHVKQVERGTTISYGGTYCADRDMVVATIPIGYGDGYPRSLSNKGEVLIGGKRAPIIGRICMDQMMVDVTDVPNVRMYDEVVLLGSQERETITIEELSKKSGRFPYEFLCCLGKRIPRIYAGHVSDDGLSLQNRATMIK